MKSRNLEISLLMIGRFPSKPVHLKSGLQPYKSTDSAILVRLNADAEKKFIQHS